MTTGAGASSALVGGEDETAWFESAAGMEDEEVP